MSGIKKAGMLIVLLALPAFFFVFLKLFGTNHYDLPYFHPALDSTGQTLFSGGDTLYYQVEGTLGLDSSGAPVDAALLDDRISVFSLPEGDTEAQGRLVARLSERLGTEEPGIQYIIDSGLAGFDGLPECVVLDVSNGSEGTDWGALLKVSEARTFSDSFLFVLVDGQRTIRGYYALSDPEEFERAVAEIKILQYQARSKARR